MTTPPDLLQAEMSAVTQAITDTVNTFTYHTMGMTFEVGKYVTDDEKAVLASAVINAIHDAQDAYAAAHPKGTP